jgi:lipoate-protein ligase A
MNTWRLLTLDVTNAFMNMAIDEAILRTRITGTVPNTLRFYRWKPSAVSAGRFQDVFKEVNAENCGKYGVDFVRRISGGGSVYHDYEGEITYSVVVSKKDLENTDVFYAYKSICNGLIEAMKILEIHADFDPGNQKRCPNVLVNGRKISGSSQFHKRGVLLQHGTLLIDVDLEEMFTFLKVPWAKTCMEVVPIAKGKITSVKRELGSNISVQEAYEALVKGFQKALKIKLVEGKLTSYEEDLAEKLCVKKFSTEDWNLRGKTVVSSFSVKPF